MNAFVEFSFAFVNGNIGYNKLLKNSRKNAGNESIADVSGIVVRSAPTDHNVLLGVDLQGVKLNQHYKSKHGRSWHYICVCSH
jgi:hypothetical protein